MRETQGASAKKSNKNKNRLTVRQVLNYEPKVIRFDGLWHALVGDPELSGSWIIWGKSFSGKSRFAMSFAKYMAEQDIKTAYISLEEGKSKSLQQAFKEMGMIDTNRKLEMWADMSVDDIKTELRKQRSPKVIVIDSLQYTSMNYAGYKKLKEEFRSKLFVFVSHANDNNEPRGTTAMQIHYDASVKVLVKGFKAYARSRFGGGTPMIIWEKMAGQNIENNNQNK